MGTGFSRALSNFIYANIFMTLIPSPDLSQKYQWQAPDPEYYKLDGGAYCVVRSQTLIESCMSILVDDYGSEFCLIDSKTEQKACLSFYHAPEPGLEPQRDHLKKSGASPGHP